MLETNQIQDISKLLLAEKIGLMPTDTIYGLHCLSASHVAIQKIYEIKQRPEDMPYITLISSTAELTKFDIVLNGFALQQCNKFWPGPNTLIFETLAGNSRSFRLPRNDFLLTLLQITGPLVSTSANIHKGSVAKTVQEAYGVFGDLVDFYVDGGELNNPPSSIFKILDDEIVKIR